MRLEFDETADRRCAALADGDAHALRHGRGSRHIETLDTHHDAITTLPLLADFHEARDRNTRQGKLQNGVRYARSLRGGDSETRGTRCKPKRERKGNRASARQERHRNAAQRQYRRRPPGRLAISGEIHHDAKSECDGQPRHQPAWSSLGRGPLRDQATQPASRVGDPIR